MIRRPRRSSRKPSRRAALPKTRRRPTPPTPVTPLPAPPPAGKAAEPDATAQSIGAASVAAVVAEAKLAAAEEEAAAEAGAATGDGSEARAGAGLSATEIERVLTSNAGPPLPQPSYTWPVIGAAGEDACEQPAVAHRRCARVPRARCAVDSSLPFRHREQCDFRSWIAPVYAALGAEITPNWDVQQYQIIDWVATAEPNSRGVGSLKITARIQNRGPLRQPYPAVQLRLKDRWEKAVGSRMFTPAEYLPRDAARGRLMSPGETARAEIEVVDPGPGRVRIRARCLHRSRSFTSNLRYRRSISLTNKIRARTKPKFA